MPTKYYNLRFRMLNNDHWGYMRVHGDAKDMKDTVQSLARIGLVVESGDYFVELPYPKEVAHIVQAD